MHITCTTKGYLWLLVGLAATAVYLIAGLADTPLIGQESGGRPPFAPSEKIDVEQAVDFPYDI